MPTGQVTGLTVAMLGLLAGPLAAWPAEPLVIELSPAWEGFTRPGAVTEIGIRLTAERGGPVALTVTTAQSQLKLDTFLEANTPLTFWLPVQADAVDRPVVAARLEGAAPVHQRLSDWQLRTAPLVAAIGQPNEPIADGEGFAVFRPRLARLPHISQAYQAIAVLWLDTTVLASLDEGQLGALQGYLAGCGRVVATGPPTDIARLRQQAGCQGQFIRAGGEWQQSSSAVTASLREPPPDLPAAAALRRLLPSPPGHGQPLAVFFLGYALVLMLLARTVRRARWLLLSPVAAVTLVLLTWSHGRAQGLFISWAEMVSGDPGARFAAVLQLTGMGRGAYTMSISATLGLPESTDSFFEFVYDPSAALNRLTLYPRLGSRQELRFSGTFPVACPLGLELDRTGPTVRSTGQSCHKNSLLIWRGQRYTVPVLASGDRWRPPAQAETWAETSMEQLLRARSMGESAVLAVPFTLREARLITADLDADGWLLIRPRQVERQP